MDLFSTELVAAYLDDPRFVSRPWLGRLLDLRLVEPACRFVLVTGEPGSGKTAFMAWLSRQGPDRPCYFIRRDSQMPLNSGDARSLLFSIGHQLAALRPSLFQPERLEIVVDQRLGSVEAGGTATGITVDDLQVSPFYETALHIVQHADVVAGELTGLSARRIVAEPRFLDLANLHYLALIDPARVLLDEAPNARIVVLVDALDELRFNPSGDSALDWLAGCPELPPNVRFVLTSRPDERLLGPFRARQATWLREVSIEAGSQSVGRDLARYAQRFAAEPAIRKALVARGLTPRGFATDATRRADGNFQYLTTLATGIEHALGSADASDASGLDRLLALADVPPGLNDLYAFFLGLVRHAVGDVQLEVRGASLGERMVISAWEGVYVRLLGVLAVARDSLSAEQLERLSGTLGRGASGALDRLDQFLDRDADGRRRLYHATLAEFLTSDATRAADSWIYLDPVEWNAEIASAYRSGTASWAAVDWAAIDDYGLLHLAWHLYSLRDTPELRDELFGLLCAPFMREKRARLGSDAPFAGDVALAVDAAGRQVPPAVAHELRCHLILASLASTSNALPVGALRLLAELGRGGQAVGLAALRRNTFGGQAAAYTSVLEGLLESGDRDQAATLLDVAIESANATTFVPSTQALAPRLAVAAARLGRFDRAFDLLDRVLGDEEQATTLVELAPLLATAGVQATLTTRSQRILDRLGDSAKGPTVRALRRLAAAAEHLPSARPRAREEAPDLAASPSERVLATAASLAATGDTTAALRALDELVANSRELQSSAIELAARLRLASALGESGAPAAAVQLISETRPAAEALRSDWERSAALAELATAMAAVGDAEGATRAARGVIAAARAFTREGSSSAEDLAAARVGCATAARVLEGLGERASALEAYACSRDAQGVRYREWGATAAAAAAIGETGDAVARAEELLAFARSGRDLERVARAWAEAAVALAAIGDHERAVAACDAAIASATASIRDRWQVYVLSRTASALTVTGDSERALPVLLRACALTQRLGRSFFFECLLVGMPTLAARIGRRELEQIAGALAETDGWWLVVESSG